MPGLELLDRHRVEVLLPELTSGSPGLLGKSSSRSIEGNLPMPPAVSIGRGWGASPPTMIAVARRSRPARPNRWSSGRCREPGPGEVLIQVAAAGVNRPDVLQRRASIRRRRARPTSRASRSPARWWRWARAPTQLVGQQVCALVAGGGYAEYCAAPAGQCLPVPDALSMVEAAAMPETLFTVWVNLFERGFAAEGDAVLVHGGTSGIGTMAIVLGGAVRPATSSSPAAADEKCAARRRARRRGGHQLQDRRISSRRCSGSPAARA